MLVVYIYVHSSCCGHVYLFAIVFDTQIFKILKQLTTENNSFVSHDLMNDQYLMINEYNEKQSNYDKFSPQ